MGIVHMGPDSMLFIITIGALAILTTFTPFNLTHMCVYIQVLSPVMFPGVPHI